LVKPEGSIDGVRVLGLLPVAWIIREDDGEPGIGGAGFDYLFQANEV
jgi:hypothetical protein